MFVPSGPGYNNVSPEQKICATTGAAAGANFVDGDVYINVNFQYYASHLWRFVNYENFVRHCTSKTNLIIETSESLSPS